MADMIDMGVLVHRLTENEALTRQVCERQIRTDEQVIRIGEGQRAMKAELTDVLNEVRDMRAEQARSSAVLNKWLRVLIVLVPLVPAIMHMAGH